MGNIFSIYKSRLFALAIIATVAATPFIKAATEVGESSGEAGHTNFGVTLLSIAVILLIAKLSGLVEKWGQPAVLGELVAGVILGNLILAGIAIFEPIKHDSIIAFLAELGVVILLFQIGLESNIQQMKKVGLNALLVAVIGVIVPFVLGTWVVGPWLMPGLEFNSYLFLGAALTATSVGITARVFKDLGKLKIPEAQIVLGAAVFDDVIGLIILAVVSAIVTGGAVGAGVISLIAGKAILFLVGAIIVGQLIAPLLGRFFSKIQSGSGMKFTLAISFGLILAATAQFIGLAPIVGAFAAGLVLDPVHFKYFTKSKLVLDVEDALGTEASERVAKVLSHHSDKHVEDLIEPLGYFLVPLFFVITGMQVKLETFADPKIIVVALAITAVAFVGKIVAGIGAGKVNKWLVGWGMVPRGEVGLIFAAIGKALGVVNDEVFSVIVIMVILTTLLTPPILTFVLKKQK